jgi:hypothetical protein
MGTRKWCRGDATDWATEASPVVAFTAMTRRVRWIPRGQQCSEAAHTACGQDLVAVLHEVDPIF